MSLYTRRLYWEPGLKVPFLKKGNSIILYPETQTFFMYVDLLQWSPALVAAVEPRDTSYFIKFYSIILFIGF